MGETHWTPREEQLHGYLTRFSNTLDKVGIYSLIDETTLDEDFEFIRRHK